MRTNHSAACFWGWNLLICVLYCDWLIKTLNQSAGGRTNDQKTFARNLIDHLGKRGTPNLNSAWNWNLKRPNSTSAYAIIDSGGFWTRYSRFQGEKSNVPYFYMPGGVTTSVSFPEVRNRNETESGLVVRMISLEDMHSENIWFYGFDHQIIKKSWNVAPVTYGRKDGKWKIEPYTFCWTRNRKQWKPGYIYPSLHKGECDDVNDENEGTNIWPSKICFLPLPVPVLFFKYLTRPSPMSKTTKTQDPRTRQKRLMIQSGSYYLAQWNNLQSYQMKCLVSTTSDTWTDITHKVAVSENNLFPKKDKFMAIICWI